MSHTNSTSNYNLPQFIGTDKPTWLTDVNGAMTNIDTAIKNASDTATTASGNATTANTNIGTMASLTTTDKSSLVGAINEVKTGVTTAQNTANSATSTATTANTNANKALTQVANFNLTSFNNLTASLTNGTLSFSSLKMAKNSDGSLAKIYGSVLITGQTTTATVTTSDTGLRPESDITINGCAICERYSSNGTSVYAQDYVLHTNGTITFEVYGHPTDGFQNYLQFIACLVFVKDFGDAPTPQA